MKTLGNIIWWFPFFGFINALVAYFFGAIFYVSVIGTPIGLGLFQLGNFYLAPFGRSMIDARLLNQQLGARQSWNLLAAILWFPLGVVLAFFTVIQVGLLFVTLIGIPVALAMAKSFGAIFNPVGKVCRSSAVRDELARRRAQAEIEAALGPRTDNLTS